MAISEPFGSGSASPQFEAVPFLTANISLTVQVLSTHFVTTLSKALSRHRQVVLRAWQLVAFRDNTRHCSCDAVPRSAVFPAVRPVWSLDESCR